MNRCNLLSPELSSCSPSRPVLPRVRSGPALVLAATLLAGCDFQVGEPSPPGVEGANLVAVSQAFRSALEGLREDFGFPGATAAFRLPDGRSIAVAVGLADVEAQRPMEPESRMMSASIGKTFVAATAISLARDGALTLDDPVSRWLGDAEWFSRLPNGDSMTLRHLLTHSSGLSDHVYDEDFSRTMVELREGPTADPDHSLAPRELIEFILDEPPLFAPGDGYSYTDTGYILVGLILEEASGQSYYDLVRERFLKPLDLGLTEPSTQRSLPGLASGYVEPGSRFGESGKVAENAVLAFNPATEWTGGGLVTNPLDLVNWAAALYSGKALDEAAVREIVESGFRPPSDSPGEGLGPGDHYGLGSYVRTTELGPSLGHGGWFPGYHSLMAYYPELEISVAFQVNRDFGNDRSHYLGVLLDTLLQALETDD